MKSEMDPLVVQILPDKHQSPPYTLTKPKSKSIFLLITSTFVSIAITLGLLYVFYSVLFSLRKSSLRYSVIIDAGSSGSRVHVFKYRIESGKPAFDFGEESYVNWKTTPGLSSFADDLDGASASVQQLVDFAKEIVPMEMFEKTDIRLMATAGMRLLDEDVQEKILDVTRGVLRSSGFNFTNEWASVISGSYEGVYAWVIANYALGSLGGDSLSTTGIVELGGASAQVTFVSSESVPPELQETISYGNVQYKIYTHSFLNLGQDAAHDKLRKSLRDSASTSTEIVTDPCTPNGYNLETSSHKYSSGILDEESSLTGSLQAAGDFEKCRSKTLGILQEGKENCPPGEHCPIGSIFTPNLEGNFLATENFYHTSKFFELGQNDWLTEMVPAGTRFCKEEWSELKVKYPNTEDKYMKEYCFSSAYIVSMLHDSLGLPKEYGRINFASKAGEKNIPLDWALGAFILNTPTTTSDDSVRSRKMLG